jgi:hypothetical protein
VRGFGSIPVLTWGIILFGLGACRKREATVTDAAPSALVECNGDPRKVIERAERVLRDEERWGALTPILPGTWPPAGEPVAVLYAYGRHLQPTGIESWEIRSPHVRVEVPLANVAARPRLWRLEVRQLGAEWKRHREVTPEVMAQEAAPLLSAICASVLPGPEEAARLRTYYGAWISEHGALADELRRNAPAFFAWIEAND